MYFLQMEVCKLAGCMQRRLVDIAGNMAVFHRKVMKVTQKSDVPSDILLSYLADRLLFFQSPYQDIEQEQLTGMHAPQ